ncbi:unnamed protein product [Pleuronectes platessa]|uniref:Uncharacterized protein n=1 Tax=Pleuronectes platessa TaxID=8262 RepID=A0A9N7Z2W4_PLEPL|nr:unnamed protein product [Pleuronectes platessa]
MSLAREQLADIVTSSTAADSSVIPSVGLSSAEPVKPELSAMSSAEGRGHRCWWSAVSAGYRTKTHGQQEGSQEMVEAVSGAVFPGWTGTLGRPWYRRRHLSGRINMPIVEAETPGTPLNVDSTVWKDATAVPAPAPTAPIAGLRWEAGALAARLQPT